MTTNHVRTSLILTLLVPACLALSAACLKRFGPSLVLNETPSEPPGIYRLISRKVSDYHRGMYVMFPVPAKVQDLVYGRGWLPAHSPLLKELAGLSGDRVCVTATEVDINGSQVGVVFSRDSQDLPLPQVRGCFVIQSGQFFALSRHYEKSFDGRYFGALPLSMVSGEAVPVWTF